MVFQLEIIRRTFRPRDPFDFRGKFSDRLAWLQKAAPFDAQKMNYLMLMMKDPQVHYHVFGRPLEVHFQLKRPWVCQFPPPKSGAFGCVGLRMATVKCEIGRIKSSMA